MNKINVKWMLKLLMHVMQKFLLIKCIIKKIGQVNKRKMLLTSMLKTLIEITWLNTLVWIHHNRQKMVHG